MTDTEIIKKVLADPKYGISADREFEFCYINGSSDRYCEATFNATGENFNYSVRISVTPNPRKVAVVLETSTHARFVIGTGKVYDSTDKELIKQVRAFLTECRNVDRHRKEEREREERRREEEERRKKRENIIGKLHKLIPSITQESSDEDIVEAMLSFDGAHWDESKREYIYYFTTAGMSVESPIVDFFNMRWEFKMSWSDTNKDKHVGVDIYGTSGFEYCIRPDVTISIKSAPATIVELFNKRYEALLAREKGRLEELNRKKGAEAREFKKVEEAKLKKMNDYFEN